MSTPQDTFIARTLVQDTVWSLKGADEEWAVCEFNDGEFVAMLLWPEEKGAKACATGEWSGYKPAAITLKDYVESWLPAMKEDGIMITINYGPRSHGSVIEPEAFIAAYHAAQARRAANVR